MGRCTYINIFNQASFAKEVWSLASTVMDKFEAGELKGQSSRAPSKSTMSKPDFRQQHFACIQSLPDEFKVEVLTEVSNGEMSLHEMKQRAAQYRSMKAVQRAFCR